VFSWAPLFLQVPLEELDLRRLREAAEEMREQLGVTSKAVSMSCRARERPTGQVRSCTHSVLLQCCGLRLRLLARVFLCTAVLQAEKLVAKLDALGTTAGDLGLSMFKVAKFEVRTGSTTAVAGVALRRLCFCQSQGKRVSALAGERGEHLTCCDGVCS
jgi:hypothetical protein